MMLLLVPSVRVYILNIFSFHFDKNNMFSLFNLLYFILIKIDGDKHTGTKNTENKYMRKCKHFMWIIC